MNSQERELFWNTLVSLPGEDIQAEYKKLFNTIKLPKYLYRYRPVNMKSLEALRTNRLYFSSANYYDDPFDTFLHINIDAIKSEYITAFQSRESTEQVVEGVKNLFTKIATEEQLAQITVDNVLQALENGLIENFLNSALAMRDEIKKDVWSVCFSENGFNEALWLKYADQHKGFALIYDLEKSENLLCGKQAKCQDCGITKYGTPLYPMYYSDTPYDATNFAKLVMLRKVGEMTGLILIHTRSRHGNPFSIQPFHTPAGKLSSLPEGCLFQTVQLLPPLRQFREQFPHLSASTLFQRRLYCRQTKQSSQRILSNLFQIRKQQF